MSFNDENKNKSEENLKEQDVEGHEKKGQDNNEQGKTNKGIDEDKLHDVIKAAISMLNSREYSVPGADSGSKSNDYNEESSHGSGNYDEHDEPSYNNDSHEKPSYNDTGNKNNSVNKDASYKDSSYKNSSYSGSSYSGGEYDLQEIKLHIKDELEHIIQSLDPGDLRVIDKYAIRKSMTIDDYAQLHASFVDPRLISLALSARPYLAKEGKANLVDLFLKTLNALTLFQDLKKTDLFKGM